MIGRLSKRLQKLYPDAEIVSGTMDDFYYELVRYDLKSLPVIKKDLADTWIHGISSYPDELALLRQNRRRMERLQEVYARKLFEGWDDADEAESILDVYYEAVSLFEEHTWGADVKTWLGGDRSYKKNEFVQKKKTKGYQFLETSWTEQRERIHKADSCGAKLAMLLGEKKNSSIKEETKDIIDALRVTRSGENSKIEHERYVILFSEVTGQIFEIYDKALMQTILKARGKEGVFSYRYDKYGYDDINEYLRHYGYHFTTWGILDYGREGYPLCEHETFYPIFEKYEIDGNRITFFYYTSESSEKYGDALLVKIAIVLPKEGNRLQVSLGLCRKQESPYVEAGSFILPFEADRAEFRVQKGGTLLNPVKDLAQKSNHSLYCLENGMIAMDEEKGICIRPLDTPLVSIGDPGIYVYKPEYIAPDYPDIYVNLFNNMWGTNFPQWIGGDMEFHFEIECFDGKTADTPKEYMQMLGKYGCAETLFGKNISSVKEVRFPEGMKLIGTRKYGKGFCLYFSEVWGMTGEKSFEATGYSICLQDLMGRQGNFYKDKITFVAVSYGIQCLYLEKR